MPKSKQPPLFNTPEFAEPEVPTTAALSLKFSERSLSPEQLRFNKLLQRIEKLTSQIEQTRAMADRLLPLQGSTLQPLEERSKVLEREMVLLLAARLATKGLKLTAVQLRTAKSMICSISVAMAMDGDAEMVALHDAHSEQSIAELKQEAEDDARAYFSEILDDEIEPPTQGQPQPSMEELVSAAMEKQRESYAKFEELQSKAAASKAKGKQQGKQSQRQQKQALEEQDAQTALKTIYRQLASALHPDREPDAAERVRKTALMGDANAAYQRRDLLALLKLQLQIEQIDASGIANMAKDRLAALARLLKEQAEALEYDLEILEQRLKGQFELMPYMRLSEAAILRAIEEDRQDLSDDIARMEYDMLEVQSDAGLKQWLKLQNALMKEDERMARDMRFDDFF